MSIVRNNFGQFNVYLQLSSARVITLTNLDASYYNGPSNNGVFATLTANSNGALVVDGITVRASERIVINGQTNSAHNGVYLVLHGGNSGTPWVLQRANDFQNIGQIRAGLYIPIDAGTLLAGSIWIVDDPIPNYLGIDAINFVSQSNPVTEVSPDEVQNEVFIFATDTGVADAYAVALNPAVTSYVDGLEVVMVPANNNLTTIPTLNVNGLGVIPIVDSDGSALEPDAIITGVPANFKLYNNQFYLQNSAGGIITPEQIQNEEFTFAQDTGVTNIFDVTLTPAPAAYVDGLRFTMLSGNSNTIPNPVINVNDLGDVQIYRSLAIGLNPGDIQPSVFYDFVYSVSLGGIFILLNPSTGAFADQRAAGNASWFTSTDNGAVNAYKIDLPVYLSSPAGGFVFVRAANTNTGASTLEVTDLSGNLTLGQISSNGSPLVGGEIVAQQMYGFLFNPGTAEWDLLNSSLTASFTWIEVTGTSATMKPNHGYIANNAGLVTLTLPTAFAVGDEIKVAGLGAGGWAIAQNAGQTIHLGASATTAGVGGSLASTNRYDSINMLGAVADLELITQGGPQGTITVV